MGKEFTVDDQPFMSVFGIGVFWRSIKSESRTKFYATHILLHNRRYLGKGNNPTKERITSSPTPFTTKFFTHKQQPHNINHKPSIITHVEHPVYTYCTKLTHKMPFFPSEHHCNKCGNSRAKNRFLWGHCTKHEWVCGGGTESSHNEWVCGKNQRCEKCDAKYNNDCAKCKNG